MGSVKLVSQLPHDDVCGVGESFGVLSQHHFATIGRARLNYVSAFGSMPTDSPPLSDSTQLSATCRIERQAGNFNSPLAFVSMIWGNVQSTLHAATRIVDSRRLQTSLRVPWGTQSVELLVLQHADMAESSECFLRALAQLHPR